MTTEMEQDRVTPTWRLYKLFISGISQTLWEEHWEAKTFFDFMADELKAYLTNSACLALEIETRRVAKDVGLKSNISNQYVKGYLAFFEGASKGAKKLDCNQSYILYLTLKEKVRSRQIKLSTIKDLQKDRSPIKYEGMEHSGPTATSKEKLLFKRAYRKSGGVIKLIDDSKGGKSLPQEVKLLISMVLVEIADNMTSKFVAKLNSYDFENDKQLESFADILLLQIIALVNRDTAKPYGFGVGDIVDFEYNNFVYGKISKSKVRQSDQREMTQNTAAPKRIE